MSYSVALQMKMTRPEDRATQRCDPSAEPGAKTGVGAGLHRPVPLLPSSLRDWHQRDKPSRHDAATVLTGCPSQLANLRPAAFQFPVNQDRIGQPPRAQRSQRMFLLPVARILSLRDYFSLSCISWTVHETHEIVETERTGAVFGRNQPAIRGPLRLCVMPLVPWATRSGESSCPQSFCHSGWQSSLSDVEIRSRDVSA